MIGAGIGCLGLVSSADPLRSVDLASVIDGEDRDEAVVVVDLVPTSSDPPVFTQA
jgi:hypothetical protein